MTQLLLRPRHKARLSALGLSVAALMSVFPSTSFAKIATEEWKYREAFTIAAPGMIKIAVPTETFGLARPGFADLRVLGPDGEEVPYLIGVPATPQATSIAPTSFRVQLRRSSTEIVVETGTVAPIQSIQLTSGAREFLKAARVETSLDGTSWTLLFDGEPLVRQRESPQARLPLRNVSTNWLRITLDDERMPPVAFTGAELTVAPAQPLQKVAVPTEIVARDEFVGETMLTLALPAPELPLIEIELAVNDPLFSQPVTVTERQLSTAGESIERTLASAVVSRAGVGSGVDHLTLLLSGAPVARELQLHVANGSSAPLSIPSVSMRRKPVWLIFRAPNAGSYALLTGHTQIAAPAYDLAALADQLRDTIETRVLIAHAEESPTFQKADALKGAAATGAEIDPSKWKFRKPVRVVTAGVQEVEPDLEVLAHSQSDFGDLRLVRDGRQIPYVLERTAQLRPFAVQLEAANDPKRPRVSRWKITVPVSGIPLRQISFESPSVLFSRTVQLVEEVEDARGEIGQRWLSGTVQWNRSPDRPAKEFAVEFTTTPRTDTLFLETDNGDNLPITLSRGRGACMVTRLLFPTDVGPLDLYYGEPSAAAPRYDLSLIASRVVREEKNSARLGAGERVDGRATGDSALAGLPGGVLLWVALAAVVAVLLLVISRLLPKRPPDQAQE